MRTLSRFQQKFTFLIFFRKISKCRILRTLSRFQSFSAIVTLLRLQDQKVRKLESEKVRNKPKCIAAVAAKNKFTLPITDL